MKLMFLFLVIFLTSTCLSAMDIDSGFEVTINTYADGILLEMDNRDSDLQLTVAGPGDFRFTQRYSSANPVFLDINNANGERLEDGFYKYEAMPLPAFTISREESSKMPDRNSLINTTGPKVSAVTGSFRIVNGMIIDPELVEYTASTEKEAAK